MNKEFSEIAAAIGNMKHVLEKHGFESANVSISIEPNDWYHLMMLADPSAQTLTKSMTLVGAKIRVRRPRRRRTMTARAPNLQQMPKHLIVGHMPIQHIAKRNG